LSQGELTLKLCGKFGTQTALIIGTKTAIVQVKKDRAQIGARHKGAYP